MIGSWWCQFMHDRYLLFCQWAPHNGYHVGHYHCLKCGRVWVDLSALVRQEMINRYGTDRNGWSI
jgi:hypothetical protein